MMRYLFCESSPNFGGQEQQILLQMAGLGRAGHSCVLACKPGSAIAGEATRRGLEWVPVPFLNSLHLPSVWALHRLIRSRAVNVALCHSGHDANILAFAARTVLRRPVLLRARTYLAGRVRPGTVNRFVDRTVVPSEYLRRLIIANPAVRPGRVQVLRPIVPFEDLQKQSLFPLPESLAGWLCGRAPVVVQAAMLRSEKGHRTTLDAITALKNRYPNFACVFAGSGPKEADLRRRVEKLGLVAHVCFAGLVVPVAPLLARADVVIMPSRNEPLGLAQLEALALGVPVVVSDAGGLPETVVDGETGWVVPAGDPGAWAAAIASAVDDPKEALRRASLGGEWVRAGFSGAAHLRALDEIVATARQPR